MKSKYWLGITLILLLVLLTATLFLFPWSPLRVTSLQGQEIDEILAQPTAAHESEKEASQTSTSQATRDNIDPTATASQEEPITTMTTKPEFNADFTTDGPSGLSQGQSSPNIDDLIQATEDPDWRARWDAVTAIGNLKDPLGIPALIKRALYDDNPHPRWRSLWALSAIDREGSEAIPLLLPALESADLVVVRNAAVALAFFDCPDAIPELLEGLKDTDEFRRWEAVFSLRNIGDSEVAKALIRLLDGTIEPAKRVRGEVALTLGRIGGQEVTLVLLNALQNDASPQVRWRSALALSRLGDASLVNQLEQALTTEQDPQVRESIEDAIARVGKN